MLHSPFEQILGSAAHSASATESKKSRAAQVFATQGGTRRSFWQVALPGRFVNGYLRSAHFEFQCEERRTFFRGLTGRLLLSEGSRVSPPCLFLSGGVLGTFHGFSKCRLQSTRLRASDSRPVSQVIHLPKPPPKIPKRQKHTGFTRTFSKSLLELLPPSLQHESGTQHEKIKKNL